MPERVTSTSATQAMLNDIHGSSRRLDEARRRIASGRMLDRPSDGPAQVLTALGHRAEIRRFEQYQRNAGDAASWLAAADTALSSVVTMTHRVRDLVLQAVSASADSVARSAAAAEIRGIRDDVLALANTRHLGRPIFAGTAGVSAAYGTDGTYLGDGGAVHRSVAPGVTVRVNTTGPEIFGTHDPADASEGNLFQILGTMADSLEAADVDSAREVLGRLDELLDVVGLAQVQLGARARRVDEALSRNDILALELRSELSRVEDVDYAEAIIDLQAREMAYQAALAVTGRVIQPSLLDFLR